MISGVAFLLVAATNLLAGPPSSARAFVDARASVRGDGSQARPFQTLEQALESSAQELILAPGRYVGPFRPRPGLRLSGVEGTILASSPGQPVLEVDGPLTVSGVRVEVSFVGIVDRKGALALEDVTLVGAPGSTGLIALGQQGKVSIAACRFSGPFGTSLQARGGSIRIEGTRIETQDVGVDVRDAHVTLSEVEVSGGTGSGIRVTRGSLNAVEVVVRGGEYGVLLTGQARGTLERVTSISAKLAGVAVVGSSMTARDLLVLLAGPFGGVQLVGADVRMERFWVHQATAYGISGRSSTLNAAEGVVSDTLAERDGLGGDALHIRGGKVQLRSLQALRSAGSAVWVAEGATLEADALGVTPSSIPPVVADSRASLRIEHVRLAQPPLPSATPLPFVSASGRATAKVGLLEATAAPAHAWVDCGSGARLEVEWSVGASLSPSACVRVGTR